MKYESPHDDPKSVRGNSQIRRKGGYYHVTDKTGKSLGAVSHPGNALHLAKTGKFKDTRPSAGSAKRAALKNKLTGIKGFGEGDPKKD